MESFFDLNKKKINKKKKKKREKTDIFIYIYKTELYENTST